MEKQQPLFPPNKSQLEKLSNLHKAMGDRTRMEILWKLMTQTSHTVWCDEP